MRLGWKSIMINKIIYSAVKKCQKNWQYKDDETSCLFNVKIISSLLLYLNLIAFFLLFLNRDRALKLMFFSKNQNLLLTLVYPLIFFILFSLVFTKRRVSQYNLTEREQRKYYRIYILFMLLTIVFLAGVILFEK